jgi:hypothetical protein
MARPHTLPCRAAISIYRRRKHLRLDGRLQENAEVGVRCHAAAAISFERTTWQRALHPFHDAGRARFNVVRRICILFFASSRRSLKCFPLNEA